MKKFSVLVAIVAVIMTGCIIVPVGDHRGYYGHHYDRGYSDRYRDGYYDSHRDWSGHGYYGR